MQSKPSQKISEAKMKNFINKLFHLIFLITIIITSGNTFAQSNNNSYVFDGEFGYAEILDGNALTTDADQTSYQYFDNPSFSNDSISVEAWVYLIGENPGEKMPIVYRAFDDGYETFSLYVQDRVAYFSIGNGIAELSTINESPIPAFSWVHLAATYDGNNLKLYYGGDLVATQSGV